MALEQATGTQNTQYDKIGTKYNAIKTLPAAEPEEPSVVKALGNIQGARCLGTFVPSLSPYSSYTTVHGRIPKPRP
jgi:hypothetical protein